MRTNDIKEIAEGLRNGYEERKRQAFLELVIGMAESYMDSCAPDNEYSVADFCEDTDIEFEYPDIYEWTATEIATAQEDHNNYLRDEEVTNG